MTLPANSYDTSMFRILIEIVSRYNTDNEEKLKIVGIFFKSKGHNCTENYLPCTEFELKLRSIMTHPYTSI